MKFAAILLLIFSFSASAAEVLIPVRLEPLPDRAVERVLSDIKGPKRVLKLPVASRTKLGDNDPVQILGAISDLELQNLLISASYERQRAPQLKKMLKWHIEVVTNGEFAKVKYSFECPGLCGIGTDLVFRRKQGAWSFQYKASQWVS